MFVREGKACALSWPCSITQPTVSGRIEKQRNWYFIQHSNIVVCPCFRWFSPLWHGKNGKFIWGLWKFWLKLLVIKLFVHQNLDCMGCEINFMNFLNNELITRYVYRLLLTQFSEMISSYFIFFGSEQRVRFAEAATCLYGLLVVLQPTRSWK